MATLSQASCRYVINHVVLPPKLPQSAEDDDVVSIGESHLVNFLSTHVESYRTRYMYSASRLSKAWMTIVTMLKRFGDLTSSRALSSDEVACNLRLLQRSDVLLLQLRAQNAALILRRRLIDVTFECFEVSPDAASVIGARGSLIRRFPAHAIAIPLTVFDDHKFQCELAFRLSQLDTEVVQEMMPQSLKAGKSSGEIRDTTHPGLVTEMLMATLASLGSAVQVRQISKRIRDDVLWDNCMYPWRRSPLWLAVRVAIQSTLSALLPSGEATIQYKNFSILVLTELASEAKRLNFPDDICQMIVTKIARRSCKLGADLSSSIQDRAMTVCQDIKATTELKWQTLQIQDGERPATMEKRIFGHETALNLRSSKHYLDTILNQDSNLLQNQMTFAPACEAKLIWHRGIPSLGTLRNVAKEEVVQRLAAFENWSCQMLPIWTEQRLTSVFSDQCRARDCMILADTAVAYRDIALPTYDECPEQLSMMYLTVAELWYALDLLTVEAIPLFGEFSPDLCSGLFEPLLLPKKAHMKRLMHIEDHIGTRQTQAKRENPAIFSDPVDDSFAVQYYKISRPHQRLRKRIERDAAADREAKADEWKTLSATY